jgi:hypothetical protein
LRTGINAGNGFRTRKIKEAKKKKIRKKKVRGDDPLALPDSWGRWRSPPSRTIGSARAFRPSHLSFILILKYKIDIINYK